MKVVKTIIAVMFIFFALISIILGIDSIANSIHGFDEVKFFRGNLNVEEDAKDEAMGLDGLGPILVRKTEMYQYEYELGSDDEEYAIKGFYDCQKSSFTIGSKHYDNPEFPEELKTETIYGTVTIGDEGYELTKYVMSKFLSPREEMIDKEMVPAKPLTEDVSDYADGFGLKPIGDGKYSNNDGGDWKIGDIVVSYQMLDPSLLDDEYTVIVETWDDGKLGADWDDVNYIYNRYVEMDEVKEDFKEFNKSDGLFFIGMGLIIILAAAVIIWSAFF